jgi:hypothetical protein
VRRSRSHNQTHTGKGARREIEESADRHAPASGTGHSMLVHLPVASKNDVNAPITMARPEIIPATEADHVFQSLYIGDTVIRNNPKSDS